MTSIEQRRRNMQENRERILEAAISLFQQKGFENVTVDEIVKQSGFSRGTFYKLFLGKEDLVISYMARWNGSYAEYYHKELEGMDCGAMDKLERLVRYMLTASTLGGQSLQRVAISSGMHDKLLADKISKSDAEITDIIMKLLLEAREQGAVSTAYSEKELCRMIYIVLEGIALRWAGEYDGQPVEKAAGSALDLLFITLNVILKGGRK